MLSIGSGSLQHISVPHISQEVPPSIAKTLVGYLEPSDILSLSQVSRRWRSLPQDNQTLRTLIENCFPGMRATCNEIRDSHLFWRLLAHTRHPTSLSTTLYPSTLQKNTPTSQTLEMLKNISGDLFYYHPETLELHQKWYLTEICNISEEELAQQETQRGLITRILINNNRSEFNLYAQMLGARGDEEILVSMKDLIKQAVDQVEVMIEAELEMSRQGFVVVYHAQQICFRMATLINQTFKACMSAESLKDKGPLSLYEDKMANKDSVKDMGWSVYEIYGDLLDTRSEMQEVMVCCNLSFFGGMPDNDEMTSSYYYQKSVRYSLWEDALRQFYNRLGLPNERLERYTALLDAYEKKGIDSSSTLNQIFISKNQLSRVLYLSSDYGHAALLANERGNRVPSHAVFDLYTKDYPTLNRIVTNLSYKPGRLASAANLQARLYLHPEVVCSPEVHTKTYQFQVKQELTAQFERDVMDLVLEDVQYLKEYALYEQAKEAVLVKKSS